MPEIHHQVADLLSGPSGGQHPRRLRPQELPPGRVGITDWCWSIRNHRRTRRIVDAVRCRIQREQTDHHGRTGDPLYRIRRLLRRAADHHTPRFWARLLAGLDAGDTPDEQLARTWIAAQNLRLIYHSPNRARAEQALHRWLTSCADSGIPELIRLATTIDSWRSELLAYFTTGGISNGPTEAINLLVKR